MYIKIKKETRCISGIEIFTVPENEAFCFYKRKIIDIVDGVKYSSIFVSGFSTVELAKKTTADKAVPSKINKTDICAAIPREIFNNYINGKIDFGKLSEKVGEIRSKQVEKYKNINEVLEENIVALLRPSSREVLNLNFIPYPRQN